MELFEENYGPLKFEAPTSLRWHHGHFVAIFVGSLVVGKIAEIDPLENQLSPYQG